MPRLGNSNTDAAAGSVTNRTGQLKFCWSFRYEFDLPNGPQEAGPRDGSLRGSAAADNLSAMLDKALAYAG